MNDEPDSYIVDVIPVEQMPVKNSAGRVQPP